MSTGISPLHFSAAVGSSSLAGAFGSGTRAHKDEQREGDRSPITVPVRCTVRSCVRPTNVTISDQSNPEAPGPRYPAGRRGKPPRRRITTLEQREEAGLAPSSRCVRTPGCRLAISARIRRACSTA